MPVPRTNEFRSDELRPVRDIDAGDRYRGTFKFGRYSYLDCRNFRYFGSEKDSSVDQQYQCRNFSKQCNYRDWRHLRRHGRLSILKTRPAIDREGSRDILPPDREVKMEIPVYSQWQYRHRSHICSLGYPSV